MKLTNRNLYVEEYDQGDVCVVNGQKRKIKVFYYCDHYAGYQATENDNVN